MTRDEMESEDDRMAYDLCVAMCAEPWGCVPDESCHPRYAGYEGDYFMNWARDRVDEFQVLSRIVTLSIPSSNSGDVA